MSATLFNSIFGSRQKKIKTYRNKNQNLNICEVDVRENTVVVVNAASKIHFWYSGNFSAICRKRRIYLNYVTL